MWNSPLLCQNLLYEVLILFQTQIRFLKKFSVHACKVRALGADV